jgi:C2H2 transcription facotor
MSGFVPVNANAGAMKQAPGAQDHATPPATPGQQSNGLVTPETNIESQPSSSTKVHPDTPPKSSHGMEGQRPLPQTPPTASVSPVTRTPSTVNEGNTMESEEPTSPEDVESPEDDDQEQATTPKGTPTKKKNNQKFHCTDYPPCQLSFTRSEHLARHIRLVFSFYS